MSTNNPILDDLETRISQEIQAQDPVLDNLKDLEQEVEDIMRSIFAQWDLEDQDHLRILRKQLHAKINDLNSTLSLVEPLPSSDSVERERVDISSSDKKSTPPTRDPQAEALMNQAEAAFYNGHHQEAIQLYEKVLMIEPNWSRAEEHYQKAKEYLQTGNIPEIALPAEAAVLYGKAQSASRVMDYERALAYYEEAKKSLRAAGITRFQEGQEFENNVKVMMDAQDIYNQAIQAFQAGDLEMAIQKMQVAYDTVSFPLYQDKLAEYRDVQTKLEQISQKLSTRPIDLQLVEGAQTELDQLRAKYGANPLLEQMSILELQALELAVERGLYSVDRRIADAKSTPRIEDARTYIEDAESTLSTLENAWPGGEELSSQMQSLRDELRDVQMEIDAAQETLDEQNLVSDTSNRISELKSALNTLSQYPKYRDDPEVKEIGKKIKSRIIRIRNGRVSIFFSLIGIAAVGFALFSVFIGNTVGFFISASLATFGLIVLVIYLLFLR